MMKKKKHSHGFDFLFEILGLGFFIGIWILISFCFKNNGNFLFPDPIDTFSRLSDCFLKETSKTFVAIGWSLLRILIGWLSSFLIAAILGTLAALFPFCHHFLKPTLTIFRCIPTVAIVIILSGIFLSYQGLPDYIPSFLVFLVAFPLIYEAFFSGISNESTEIKNSLDLEGGYRTFRAVRKVLWPDAFPYIALAATQSFGLSVKVAIMSEVITNNSSSHSGIGTLISISRSFVDMESVMAYSAIAVLIVLIIDLPLLILKRKIKLENRAF